MADPPPLLGFLFSYWYCRTKDMDALLGPLDPKPPTFVDSGAFSAYNLGGSVSLDEYVEWIRKWEHWFPVYANLDDKGSWQQSAVNQERMESIGMTPIPVYHTGEPWDVLQDMADRYDYIALGGTAGGSKAATNPKTLGWWERCFEICDGRAALHGFGLTSWRAIIQFPWRSVDSSAIGAGYRYGKVSCYDPYTKTWRKWDVSDKRAWGRYGWLVRDYEMTPADFAAPRSRECTQNLIRLATRSMRRAINDVPAMQMYVVDDGGKQAGLRRLEAFNEANGPTMYLADTDLRPATVQTFNEANA